MKLFHNKFFTNYNGLSTGQILFDDELNLKLGLGLSKRLCYEKINKSLGSDDGNKGGRRNKNQNLKSKIIKDSFEVGVVLLSCMIGEILYQILYILERNMTKELFIDFNDIKHSQGEEIFDVFRLLEIRSHKKLLKCSERLGEHYNSFYHLIIGSARPHQKKSLIEICFNKKSSEIKMLKFLQKLAENKLKNYSKQHISLIKSLTQIDKDDRMVVEEVLQRNYGSGSQQKLNSTIFQTSMRRTFLAANQDSSVRNNLNSKPGGVNLEEIVLINPDLSQMANVSNLNESSLLVDKVINSLVLMYRHGDRWYQLDDKDMRKLMTQRDFQNSNFGTMRKGSKSLVLTKTSTSIIELSKELGCSPDLLWNKLKVMIKRTN